MRIKLKDGQELIKMKRRVWTIWTKGTMITGTKTVDNGVAHKQQISVWNWFPGSPLSVPSLAPMVPTPSCPTPIAAKRCLWSVLTPSPPDLAIVSCLSEGSLVMLRRVIAWDWPQSQKIWLLLCIHYWPATAPLGIYTQQNRHTYIHQSRCPMKFITDQNHKWHKCFL